MARILVVEDHRGLAHSIAEGLRDQDHLADIAVDGEQALSLTDTEAYDLILLDLNLPKKDGYAVVQTLRDRGLRTPVLCLTARDGLSDKVRGLDLGADDYLVKPFEWSELLARVRVLIRRGHGQSDNSIQVGDLTIDTLAKSVSRAGQPVHLTAKEYALLLFLAYRRDCVVSRAEIWDKLYSQQAGGNSNVVDVYIGYLRNKIDRDHASKLIQTRRGAGYVLTAEAPINTATERS